MVIEDLINLKEEITLIINIIIIIEIDLTFNKRNIEIISWPK